jgi:hypothetical protein
MNTRSNDHSEMHNKQAANTLEARAFPLFKNTSIIETTKLNSPDKLISIINQLVSCVIILKLGARYPAGLKTFVEQILQFGIY